LKQAVNLIKDTVAGFTWTNWRKAQRDLIESNWCFGQDSYRSSAKYKTSSVTQAYLLDFFLCERVSVLLQLT